jgi:hypothetical protein
MLQSLKPIQTKFYIKKRRIPMKTKKLSKRLVLNKETIVHMDDGKLIEIQGGISTQQCVEQSLLGCPTETLCWSNCAAGLAC